MEIKVSYSYLSASIDGVQSRWVQTLKDIRAVNNRKAKEMYLNELRDIYAEAEDLIKYQLFPIHKAQLEHILSRPIDQHIALLINATKHSHIASY